MARIGTAVCLSAMSLMGVDMGWRTIPALVKSSELWKWSPGAGFGLALDHAMKRWGHPLILPASVVLAVGGYHLVLDALGISADLVNVDLNAMARKSRSCS